MKKKKKNGEKVDHLFLNIKMKLMKLQKKIKNSMKKKKKKIRLKKLNKDIKNVHKLLDVIEFLYYLKLFMLGNKYLFIIHLFLKEKLLIKKNYFFQVKNILGKDFLHGNILNQLGLMKSIKKK